MKVLRFAFIQFKKEIKDYKTLAFGLMMPILVITCIYFGLNSSSSSEYADVVVNVNDKGSYAGEMLKNLNITKSVFYNDAKAAVEVLKKNDAKAVYIIPKDFTEKIKNGIKPVIITYKNVKGNETTPIEAALNDWVNKKIKTDFLINKGIIKNQKEITSNLINAVVEKDKNAFSEGEFFTILMIINFLMFSANGIATELVTLKKQKILSRAITTSSKGWEIIGGVYLGDFLTNVFINTTVYLIEKFIVGFSLNNFLLAFICIVLTSLVAISLGIFVVRVCENESVVSFSIALITIVTTFLGMVGIVNGYGGNSWVIQNLAKFAPQYWVFDSLQSHTLLPGAIVLLLMALVLFTAGNYKVKNFVNR